MAITTDNIRDSLGRPKGLLTATIEEYISMRTIYVDKVARDDYYLVDATNAVTTAQKENAIKALVAVDCLTILVDTVPSAFSNADDARFQDRRFQYQLDVFRKRANDALSLISDSGSRAFAKSSTDSRRV